ncbi:MAG: metal-dependent hydrolase [Thermaerobacterales bacterium]
MTNKLQYLGHSGWQITTGKGKILFIDPWLSGNPLAPLSIDELPAADYVLLTHDHGDHAGDAVAVVNQTGATLVGQPEIVGRYQAAGVPADQTLGMNIGGSIDLGGVTVTMTDAYHSSETGQPAGFILTLEDGKVLYHAGDTGIHSNMATWGELYDMDLALLPIGSHFTMDARQAAHALKMLKAKAAIPIHYKTFPLLAQSADEFIELAGNLARRPGFRWWNPAGSSISERHGAQVKAGNWCRIRGTIPKRKACSGVAPVGKIPSTGRGSIPSIASE